MLCNEHSYYHLPCHVARMGQRRTVEGNGLLRRPRSRCENYIKGNLKGNRAAGEGVGPDPFGRGY